MSSSKILIQTDKLGFVFKVYVLPQSSKNMIAGVYGDALKIKLTAPPVEGAANKMCIKYLSKCLGVAKSSLKIVSGYTSRTKMVHLRYQNDGYSEDERKSLKMLIESLVITSGF